MVHSLFCVDQATVYACGRDGLVATTTDGGESWTATIVDSAALFTAIWFTAPTTGYVCGYNTQSGKALLYRTTTGGVAWDWIRDGGTNTSYTALYFTSADTGFLGMTVGTNGSILRTTDAGESWTTLGGIAYIRALCFADQDTGIAVGQGGAVYKTVNAGTSWVRTFQLPDAPLHDFYSVFFADRRTVFAAGDNGYLYKSTDAGESWAPSNGAIAQTLRLTSLWFTDAAVGYVVGDSGTILKTTDAGATWNQHESPTEEYLSSVTFVGQSIGFAAGGHGTVLKTTSGGIVSVGWEPSTHSSRIRLEQNYPNPFNPSTTIRIHIPPTATGRSDGVPSAEVRLVVVDLLGRTVSTLVDGRRSPGSYDVTFDGSGLPSGTYFYRLIVGEVGQMKKMILVK
jgi:photosystem II stability/assembly factor-like uncharacterized protein